MFFRPGRSKEQDLPYGWFKQEGGQPINQMMDSPRRIAHDLNNVAFVISGYAQQIEESLPKEHELQADVQQILAEIPRLTAIVERIRSFDPEAAACLEPMIGDSIIGSTTTHKPRILLVEDEPALRDLLRHALERRQPAAGVVGPAGRRARHRALAAA